MEALERLRSDRLGAPLGVRALIEDGTITTDRTGDSEEEEEQEKEQEVHVFRFI